MATPTLEQFERLQTRVTKIERTLNDILEAQKQFISLLQWNQLSVVWQQDFADVSARTVALEERVEAIEKEPIT